jgi:hypothetical protein
MGQPVSTPRALLDDPRTVARDIPGVLDALFPHLIPGVVAHFNRKGRTATCCAPIPPELIAASALQHAMLFELAVVAAEEILILGAPDLDALHLQLKGSGVTLTPKFRQPCPSPTGAQPPP